MWKLLWSRLYSIIDSKRWPHRISLGRYDVLQVKVNKRRLELFLCANKTQSYHKNLDRLYNLPCLKVHAAGLDGPLHDHQQLKPLSRKIGGVDVVKGRIFVYHVNNLQGPDEEDAAFVSGVGIHLHHLHLMVDLSLLSDASPEDFY